MLKEIFTAFYTLCCVLGIYIKLMLVLKRHAKFLLKSTGTQNSIINIVKPIQLKV